MYFPYITICGIPFVSMEKIAKAGFNGVEIHLAGHRSPRTLMKAIKKAEKLGLEVTLHQAWSLSENPTHFTNHVLNWLGCLPKDGYTLHEHFKGLERYPKVVYADRVLDVEQYGQAGLMAEENFWLQTISTFGPIGRHKMPFAMFISCIENKPHPLVFDTQHFLEYYEGVRGVSGLTWSTPERLLGILMLYWSQFGSQVREIHLVDFDHNLGHDKGRNVMLGTGVLPLMDFGAHVMASGHLPSIITPEVNPLKLLRASAQDLRKVADYARSCFPGATWE